MHNIETIRQQYQSMSDAQLLQLADVDLENLTPEALEIFHEEIMKRNLEFRSAYSVNNNEIETSIKIFSLDKDSLHFITDQKEKNKTNDIILEGLIERGFDETNATEILNQLPLYLEVNSKKMAGILLTGVLLLVSGMAINVLPLSRGSQSAIVIIAYCLMIVGVIRILHGYFNKKRFDNMLKNCEVQKD